MVESEIHKLLGSNDVWEIYQHILKKPGESRKDLASIFHYVGKNSFWYKLDLLCKQRIIYSKKIGKNNYYYPKLQIKLDVKEI